MMSHTGNYAVTCEYCGKGFTDKYKLKRHEMTHTGNFKYNCEVCGEGFRDNDKYRNIHCKQKHPEVYRIWKEKQEAQARGIQALQINGLNGNIL